MEEAAVAVLAEVALAALEVRVFPSAAELAVLWRYSAEVVVVVMEVATLAVLAVAPSSHWAARAPARAAMRRLPLRRRQQCRCRSPQWPAARLAPAPATKSSKL